MNKLWVLVLLPLLLISCRQNPETGLLDDYKGREFDAEMLPKRKGLNSRTSLILARWIEYNAFNSSFDALYRADNREDLILTVDDLLEKHRSWTDSEYPEEFDKPQIRSRQKVIRTYLLKLESALDNRLDYPSAAVEMVDAYNALLNQFDVLMYSTLDPNLISDEE